MPTLRLTAMTLPFQHGMARRLAQTVFWQDFRYRQDCQPRLPVCRQNTDSVGKIAAVGLAEVRVLLKRVRRGGQAGGRSVPARCRERRRPAGPCLTRKNVLEVYNLPPSPASFHLSRQRASIHVKRSPDCLPPPLRTVTFNTYYWQGPSVVPAVSLAGQLQQTAL
jgi:hypothetical protein